MSSNESLMMQDAKKYFHEFSDHIGKRVLIVTTRGSVVEGTLVDVCVSNDKDQWFLHWLKVEQEPNITRYAFGIPDTMDVFVS